MPKMKSHSGAAKRFKKTGSGRFKSKQSHLRHILTKKSSKRKTSIYVLRNLFMEVITLLYNVCCHTYNLRIREIKKWARVKRGVVARARHKKVLKQAKGYYGSS